jgi:hypothetical protein
VRLTRGVSVARPEEKRLYPSQQRRLIVRTLTAMGASLSRYLRHVGIQAGSADPVDTALAHYRGPDGRYRMHAFAADLLGWEPVAAAFDRITSNS